MRQTCLTKALKPAAKFRRRYAAKEDCKSPFIQNTQEQNAVNKSPHTVQAFANRHKTPAFAGATVRARPHFKKNLANDRKTRKLILRVLQLMV